MCCDCKATLTTHKAVVASLFVFIVSPHVWVRSQLKIDRNFFAKGCFRTFKFATLGDYFSKFSIT